MSLPHSYVANVMSAAMFPAFAKLQGEPSQVRRGYLLLTKLTATIAAPSMVTLAIVAPHIVSSLYGPQWSGVIVPLQILAMGGYFRALYHLGGVVAQSHGQVYSELRRQIVYASLVIGGASVGSPYGLPGVAAGVSVATLFMFIAMAHLALRITKTHGVIPGRQMGALVAAGITGGVASVRILLESGDGQRRNRPRCRGRGGVPFGVACSGNSANRFRPIQSPPATFVRAARRHCTPSSVYRRGNQTRTVFGCRPERPSAGHASCQIYVARTRSNSAKGRHSMKCARRMVELDGRTS
jgi:hypothetical protein